MDVSYFLITQHCYDGMKEIAATALFVASDDADDVTEKTPNVDRDLLAARLLFPLNPAAAQPAS